MTDRYQLAAKFVRDMQSELQHSISERPLIPQMFAHLVSQVGELAGALDISTRKPDLVSENEIYLEAVRVAVMALRLAAEGDAAFPYNPAEVTANVD